MKPLLISNKCHRSRNRPVNCCHKTGLGVTWIVNSPSKVKVLKFSALCWSSDCSRVEGFLRVSEGELDPIDNVITILSPGICCIHLFNMNCLHGCLQPAFNCNEAIPVFTPLNALLMMYPLCFPSPGSFFLPYSVHLLVPWALPTHQQLRGISCFFWSPLSYTLSSTW